MSTEQANEFCKLNDPVMIGSLIKVGHFALRAKLGRYHAYHTRYNHIYVEKSIRLTLRDPFGITSGLAF
ncbi:hypothetical protein C2G38_2252923 [Gigaspora rosea]|uniref:Uncharacterized protein n=1 Tax=Gigaspora rosea TaxID=44941 RepID=A0A397UD05_9GLOM|nr:hypothetical protein C2G38_2252923 [Gigaspora rosea]